LTLSPFFRSLTQEWLVGITHGFSALSLGYTIYSPQHPNKPSHPSSSSDATKNDSSNPLSSDSLPIQAPPDATKKYQVPPSTQYHTTLVSLKLRNPPLKKPRSIPASTYPPSQKLEHVPTPQRLPQTTLSYSTSQNPTSQWSSSISWQTNHAPFVFHRGHCVNRTSSLSSTPTPSRGPPGHRPARRPLPARHSAPAHGGEVELCFARPVVSVYKRISWWRWWVTLAGGRWKTRAWRSAWWPRQSARRGWGGG
jgi:hypothetical protein